MSDDTPTRKFDASSDDAPTEILSEQAGAGSSAGAPSASAAASGGVRVSKRRLIVLGSVAGALLLIVLILLAVLLSRGSGEPGGVPTPSASATPSVTPSATPSVSATPTTSASPSPAPTVAPTTPPAPPRVIQSFDASTTQVDCAGQSSVHITFEWHAIGETLWFGVGTDNAKAQPYSDFPLNYTLDFTYQCGQPGGQQKYTVTVESSDGTLTHDTIVIRE